MRRVITAGLTRAGIACLSGVALVVLTAGPAFAEDPLGPSEGADPGAPLSTLHVLLLYVLLPVSIAVLIGTIVWLPGAIRANRYRPNRPWTATPVWFAGPADPVNAVESAEPGDLVRGGARGSW